MDYQQALAHAQQTQAANVVGLQIHGRTVEVFRPRFCHQAGALKVEYRESMLFQHGYEQAVLESEQLPVEALDLDYFVAPLSEEELDSVFAEQSEVLLHRLLDGSPDPLRCINPRDKALFTSWCISELAARNG
jgi:hypothetical protein